MNETFTEEEFFEKMKVIALKDVDTLIEKGKSYGDSWKKRGGVGAFMMLARKWDRLEVAVEKEGYDIFKVIEEDKRKEPILQDIRDLRCYLLLVETLMTMRKQQPTMLEPKSPYPKVDELNDIQNKEELLDKLPVLSFKDEDVVIIHIDFFEQPPEWAIFLESVGPHGWQWSNKAAPAEFTKYWPPEGTNCLICPAEKGKKWRYGGSVYTVTEVNAPILRNGLWIWKFLAIPDHLIKKVDAVHIDPDEPRSI